MLQNVAESVRFRFFYFFVNMYFVSTALGIATSVVASRPETRCLKDKSVVVSFASL